MGILKASWNLDMLVFVEGGKLEYSEKNPKSKDKNQQQTQPTHGIEPGPHCWEASALTTAPSLLPRECFHNYFKKVNVTKKH